MTLKNENAASPPPRKRRGRPPKAKDSLGKVYSVSVNISDYTKEGNEALSKMRVKEISLYILLVWLNRYIVWDKKISGSEEFGGEIIRDDYVFWFKHEIDVKKAISFLAYVKDNVLPNNWHWDRKND